MPGRDGTGPLGQGSGGGRRRGFKGVNGESNTAGPGGECVCPKCDYTTAHAAGQPCSEMDCPKCGTKLIRK